MTKRELRETADGLTRILEAVERGEIDCPPSLATRLDGARVALAALGAPGDKPVDVASLVGVLTRRPARAARIRGHAARSRDTSSPRAR